MNDDIRIGIEVVGDQIETQNKILNEKLSHLESLFCLRDILDYMKMIHEELNDIRLLLEKNSNK